MTLPETPDRQLILLPARNPMEASAWGSATMEYAAAFQPIDFTRDPEAVDWLGYQHVTIIRPDFWPEDLPFIIKQANPAAIIDRVPVETPDALQVIFNVRVYYGWRYGPQTAFDWSQLWPPGLALIGLHGRSSGEMQDADYPIIARARIEAVKLTSHATMETVKRLRALNREMFILIRPMASFGTTDQPRRVTPKEFVEWTALDLNRLYAEDASLRYIEIHNEPNVRAEGLGASWNDGKEFGDWFLEVLALYRQLFPEGRFGFPGLSPGPTVPGVGRVNASEFLSEAAFAAQQADWIGLHSYWVNEAEMTDGREGFGFTGYRALFPEKLLFITEFGNPRQSKAEVAAQYARYYGMLRHVNGLGGIFAYVVSTPNLAESSPWAWRDEGGKDVGIAAEVGKRQYVR